jgi:hypothetical protein
MEEQLFNICDTENYNKVYDISSTNEASQKIINLLLNFVEYINQQQKVDYIKNYDKFIINRGLKTISHCFEMLLLYTKNINLALFNSKKAYIYYVEFIGQIGYNNHSFLKLNSVDAMLFVYKKTVFEIDNLNRKNYVENPTEKKYFNFLSTNINLFLLLFNTIINDKQQKNIMNEKETYANEEINNSKKTINDLLKKYCKIISNIYKVDDTIDNNNANIENIYYFIEYLEKNYTISNDLLLNIISIFVKKIKKKKITRTQIHNKIMNHFNIQKYINELSHNKLVNYIFSD